MNTRIRIAGAFLLGTAIILGAAYARAMPEAHVAAVIESAGSVEAARTYIPPKDSDGDGVSDWEKEINVVIDDVAEDTPALDLDAAQDGTLTDSFSRTFFEAYLHRNLTGPLNEEDVGDFLQKHVGQAERDARDRLYGKKDIVIDEDSDAARRAYGNAVAAIINEKTTAGAEGDLDLFQKVVQLDDADARAKLIAIKDAYETVLSGLLSTPVPPDYVGTHLVLINTYQALANNVEAMVEADNDALYAFIRLERHTDDSTALYQGLVRLYVRLYESGVRYGNDEPASVFNAYAR